MDSKDTPLAGQSASRPHVSVYWHDRADELAEWATDRLIVRTDRHGVYTDGGTATAGELTPAKLQRHFRAQDREDVIGAHTTTIVDGQSFCRWAAVDIDAHDGQEADPEANWRYSLDVAGKARALGYRPLLVDSNGKGGYHVRVFFRELVPSELVFSLVQHLVGATPKGLKAEGFPKQPTIVGKGKQVGNWLRIPGRHHKRDHWSRIWDEDRSLWLEGNAAIDAIVAHDGDPFVEPPATASPATRKPSKPRGERAAANNVEQDVVFARRALGMLEGWRDDYDRWIKVGVALRELGEAGYELWAGWSQGSPKYVAGDCHAKWQTFTPDGGLTLASLFKWAESESGRSPFAPPPGSEAGNSPGMNGKPEANSSRKATGKPEAVAKPSERPEIEISTEMHVVVAETIGALSADPNLFARGSSLVEVIRETADTAKLAFGVELRNAHGAPRVITLSPPSLACKMTARAVFYRMKKVEGELVATDCRPHDWLIQAIATRQHWEGIRPLLGIAACAYVRRDGSLSPTSGYDAETGTLISSPPIKGVKDRPTREDARAAADLLRGLVGQFPFETEADFAVWLAGLLTIVQRPAIAGPVPGIALIGNKAGIGKGLLIDLASIIATGSTVPTSNYPRDPSEAQKVRVALAISGSPVVHFDNLDGGQSYGSGPLDSALTSTVVDDRILGQSKTTGPTPLRPTWFLSGNNIVPGKDAYRRWLPCNLVTDKERPEERDDLEIRQIKGHTLANRAKYLAAAITIMRAHAQANRPRQSSPPLGSFEEWDAIVRAAVWYATDSDCCTTQRKAAEDSPERLRKIQLLEGWRELPEGGDGGRGHTVAEALDLVATDPSRFETLRAAFDGMRKGKDGLPSPESVGGAIRAIREANHGGYKFRKVGDRKRAALWVACTVYPNSPKPQSPEASNRGEDDEDGEDDSYPPAGVSERTNIYKRSYRDTESAKDRLKPSSPSSSSSPDPIGTNGHVPRGFPRNWTDPDDPMADKI